MEKTIKFNGKEIELPWHGWSGITINPDGIRTPRGLIKIDALEIAQWSSRLPRAHLTMVDDDGQEVCYRLEKLA